MFHDELVLRNRGYVSSEAQNKMRNTRLLIAGCGMGSVFAETAVRMGYEKIMLVDHDTVDISNLNRQNFTAADVGKAKVHGLEKRLKAINPEAQIQALNHKLTPINATQLVNDCDIVFDTIDFVDLPGLVGLHDACASQKKPVFTAINAGFGAVGLYFSFKQPYSLRHLLELPLTGSVEEISYAEKYVQFFTKISGLLDPQVVVQFTKVMTLLAEGKPCPAPQVSPGAMSVAALAGAVAARIAEGLPVAEAPELLLLNLTEIVTRKL